jgi:uncharacterized membrane protein YozB (DUF420 family)
MTTTTSTPARSSTRLLLGAGIVAGPMFVVTAGAQAATRAGFDLSHQPLSLLSLGDLGWIQIGNFIAAGLLSLAFAVGVGRAWVSGPASRWAPRLLAVFGLGLIIGGAFVPDAALGYPIGTPDGYPSSLSVHGLLHAVAPPLSFLALVAACFVVARRFAAQHRRTAAVTTWIVAIACLLLSVPFGPGFSWRLFAAVTLGFGWIAALAVLLLMARTDVVDDRR